MELVKTLTSCKSIFVLSFSIHPVTLSKPDVINFKEKMLKELHNHHQEPILITYTRFGSVEILLF